MSVLTGMVLSAEDIMARALNRAELTHFSLDARAYSRSLAATAKVDSTRISRFEAARRRVNQERALSLGTSRAHRAWEAWNAAAPLAP